VRSGHCRGTFARGILFPACWSYEGMHNLGFLYSIEPWLRSLYPSRGAFQEAALRHLEPFGTNPHMASFAVGFVSAMEEKAVSAPSPASGFHDNIRDIKRAAASSLAALGDSLFWGALRPACAAVSLLSALLAWPLGMKWAWCAAAAAYLTCYNAPAIWLRCRGVSLGRAWGEELPLKIQAWNLSAKMRRIRRAGLFAALLVCAAEVASSPGEVRFGLPSHLALWLACLFLRGFGVSTLRIYGAAAVAGAIFGRFAS